MFKVFLKNNWGLSLLLIFTVMSCDDIIEEDISGQGIQVVSPVDSLQSSTKVIGFFWEEVDGATQYQIQIVSSSFSSINQFVEDSLLTTTYYENEFEVGNYQWRLRALNNGYETAFTEPMSFAITFEDSVSTLSPEGFALNAPSQNERLNGEAITFRWQEIAYASNYVFKLIGYAEYTDTVNIPVLEKELLLDDGPYQWQVIAMNASYQISSELGNFVIDRTVPFAPQAIYPLVGDTLMVGDTIQWMRNSADVSFDKLFVYKDEGKDSLVNTFPKELVETAFIVSGNAALSAGNTYYYQLLSVDSAANESMMTDLIPFYLHEQ